MALPPNNFFAQNVITIPDPVSEPVGQPNVITLDFDTLGITEYSLSCAQFTSYLTYVFLTGATTGTSPTVYLPSANSLNGQTVMKVLNVQHLVSQLITQILLMAQCRFLQLENLQPDPHWDHSF